MDLLLALSVSLGAGALLLHFRPQDRTTTISSLMIVLAGVAMTGVGSRMHSWNLLVAEGVQEAGIILLGVGAIRVVGMGLFRLLLPATHISPPRIIEDIVVVAAYIAWAIVRLRNAGVDFTGIVTASAVITAIVAFSMQDTLGNILGGVALQLDDSLQLGDWIKVDDLSGQVISIRWRSIAVRTRNGEILCLPNSLLMKSRFLVLGRREEGPPQWRRWVWFEVPGDVPPGRVIHIACEEFEECRLPRVATEPRPDCVLMGMQMGLCQYAVRYWLTDLLHDDPTDSAVRVHLLAALRRNGIPLAMPQQRLRMVTENAEFEAARTRREVLRRMQALKGAALFRMLTDAECETLAHRLMYAPYAPGDVITRQGTAAHWLYLVVSGEADVFFVHDDGSRTPVNTLRAGDYFGEMALMTGAQRRATVVARTDMECYRLDKTSFEDLVQARPAIAELIAHLLADRQASLDVAQHEGQIPSTGSLPRKELLASIRRFFNLRHTDGSARD